MALLEHGRFTYAVRSRATAEQIDWHRLYLKERQAREEAELARDRFAGLNNRLKRAMQETHHRVKNNLQLIMAMLDISLMDHDETVPASELKRLGYQISTLATVHDSLTRGSQSQGVHADTISSKTILNRLLPQLQCLAQHYRFSYEAADVPVSIHQATALALIANELVSNAIKHGRTEIKVLFQVQGENAILEVEDDGPGFPADFALSTYANTGLTLVDNLARMDLNGALRFENRAAGGGGRVSLTFALSTP